MRNTGGPAADATSECTTGPPYVSTVALWSREIQQFGVEKLSMIMHYSISYFDCITTFQCSPSEQLTITIAACLRSLNRVVGHRTFQCSATSSGGFRGGKGGANAPPFGG